MQNIDNTLPVYEYIIDEKKVKEQGAGLFAISLVHAPAIEQDFYKFSNVELNKFQLLSSDKRLLTGVAMIPNLKIFRVNPYTGEKYYGYFSEQTIRDLVRLYFSENKFNDFTIEHQDGFVQGITLEESYFTSANLKSNLFRDLPVGSWIVTLHVNDDNLWNEYIKTGELKGFSIEVFADKILKNQFSNIPKCTITKSDVELSHIKQAYIEDNFDELDFDDNVELQSWANTDCQCNNCKALSAMKWVMKGVLPNSPENIKSQIIKDEN